MKSGWGGTLLLPAETRRTREAGDALENKLCQGRAASLTRRPLGGVQHAGVGGWEVYLASFPGFTDRRQVSNNGGVQGYWRRDGKELFYLSLDGDPMSVLIKPGNPPEPAGPKPLFHSRVPVSAVADQFAATADGQRFILLESPQDASSFFTILVGWPGAANKWHRAETFRPHRTYSSCTHRWIGGREFGRESRISRL